MPLWCKILIFGVCASFALFFLLKGEDSFCGGLTTFDKGNGYTFNANGISAFTYYFVWTKSERHSVSKTEAATNEWLRSGVGYETMAAFWGPSNGRPFDEWQPKGLSDKESFNISIATILAIITVALSIVLFNFRGKESLNNPDTDRRTESL
jgi:hypothetical protein